ncbi:hypothetical protein [Streptomyces sp. R44]|uniref:Secreted protein n=1 Tax=Streptomyces sp. R44 TaxID=3238633 RepID=A0AB39TEA3_9ACTN
MTSTWVLIATTAGTALTTLLGVVAGTILTSRSQRSHWARDRQADACATVLRESSALLIALSGSTHGALQRPPAPAAVDWKPWNEALAGLALIADREIVEAAHAIDEEFWNSHIKLRHGLAAPEEWFALRDAVDRRRHAFTTVARRRITRSRAELQRLTGRPAPSDPIWNAPPTSPLPGQRNRE